MILRAWDIVFIRLHERDAAGHPAVVLSSQDRLASPAADRINVLFGTKKQAAESPADQHVLLNGADGLEFLTLVDCSFVYAVSKRAVLRGAGYVSFERRREIRRKVRAFLDLG